MKTVALGVDYGTNSCRALLVDLENGAEIATAVHDFTKGDHGVIGDPRDPHLARQNPREYLDGFVAVVREVLRASGVAADQVIGIGVDGTGSTPIPLGADGRPLAFDPRFADHPAALAWLWKDHTSHAEAAEITALAREMGRPFLTKCGGAYASEWFWSKILRCARTAPEVFAAAHNWIEFADFLPAWLTGSLTAPRRGICAAGHKGLYAKAWGGWPDAEFLGRLHPGLAELRARLGDETFENGQRAGGLDPEIAAQVGLNPGTPVAIGAIDAHVGAIGAGIRPGTMVKIMGTSTCDCLVGEGSVPDIEGVCGIVPGSILPGMVGIEAGQSAVGDLFNWWVSVCGRDHAALIADIESQPAGAHGLLALDWNNGNRNVLADPLLTGLILGQTLSATAAEIFRALIEATAFGARTIIERIEASGVPVERVVACGGIAEKSPFVMRVYANILKRPMSLSRSGQTPALGAALLGAVAAGRFPSVASAQDALTGLKDTVYQPQTSEAATYDRLYALYQSVHDAFGVSGARPALDHVMKELHAIRETALGDDP